MSKRHWMIGVLFLAGTVFSPSYTWWKKSEQYQTDNSDEKNKNINNISINTTVNSTASAQIVDTVVSAVKEEVEHIKEQVSASFEMLTLIAKELIWEYKWRLGLMGSASGYGFLVFKNQQLKTYLTHPYRWHYWASMNLNPRILRLRSTNDLVWNLIREIQSRYTSAQCPDDFILPFMRFIEEIEHEINALKTYIRFGNTFEYLNISNYVFFDQNLHKQCNGWLEQAETVKAMFLHWIADYKLQQHARRLRFQLLLKGW